MADKWTATYDKCVLDEVAETSKRFREGRCRACGSPPSEHEPEDSGSWRSVYCGRCGAFVRDWNA